MKAIDDRIRNSLLLDFYGNLLTEKQKKTADFYFNCDLNLSEIAERMGITRQAVYSSLKNIVKDLEKYESRLELCRSEFPSFPRKRESSIVGARSPRLNVRAGKPRPYRRKIFPFGRK